MPLCYFVVFAVSFLNSSSSSPYAVAVAVAVAIAIAIAVALSFARAIVTHILPVRMCMLSFDERLEHHM